VNSIQSTKKWHEHPFINLQLVLELLEFALFIPEKQAKHNGNR